MPNRHGYALGLRSQSLQMTYASSRKLTSLFYFLYVEK